MTCYFCYFFIYKHMAKKKQTTESDLNQDALFESLTSDLNKLNKNGENKVEVFDTTNVDNLCGVKSWVSTGSTTLDLAISNRPNGGLPVGKICEFFGLEGTGKSAFSAYIIKDTQRQGGLAFYIDTENSLNQEFWMSLGVDFSKLIKMSLTTVEDIFENIECAITSFRKSNKDRIFTIIVDSVSGASTKQEMETGYNKDGYATQKAIILSKAMRKITNMIGNQQVLLVFNNQVRFKMNATPYEDPFTVSGGKAIAFHSSVRVKLANIKKLKKDDMVVGMTSRATVLKNRIGPPHRKAEFDFYFNGGITDYTSWIRIMKDIKIVTQAGAYYKYKSDDGETIQFQSKEFLDILNENGKLKAEIYKKVCDSSILKYENITSKTASEDDEITDGIGMIDDDEIIPED